MHFSWSTLRVHTVVTELAGFGEYPSIYTILNCNKTKTRKSCEAVRCEESENRNDENDGNDLTENDNFAQQSTYLN